MNSLKTIILIVSVMAVVMTVVLSVGNAPHSIELAQHARLRVFPVIVPTESEPA